jgi:hypothetical protein
MALNNHEHTNSTHHVETDTLTLTNNCLQPKPTHGKHKGSVVEDISERTSWEWEKSRCERMCHFPNTGGLHRTSGDAPL